MTRFSLQQRLRSAYHGLFYGISESVRWSRGAHREVPARELTDLVPSQAERISTLRKQYRVDFASSMNARTALQCYGYLDLLDGAWRAWKLPRISQTDVVCDVGCANFWYAAALHAFFAPSRLVGVEVEGFRLYADGYSRRDYALGYVSSLPGAEFVVANYTTYELATDFVTCWFPFVTPEPLLAWRMPLSLLEPDKMFARIASNIGEDGRFVMVNHSEAEADIASVLAERAGLRRARHWAATDLLVERPSPPVMSLWRRIS